MRTAVRAQPTRTRPTHKSLLLEQIKASKAALRGDFTLKSGVKSDLFFDTSKLWHGRGLRVSSDALANLIIEKDFAVFNLVAPPYKSLPISGLVTAQIAEACDEHTVLLSRRKEAKDHGEGGRWVGIKPEAKGKVIIIDDVLTAGTALLELEKELRRDLKLTVAGAFVLIDRSADSGRSNRQIEERLGFPVYAVLTKAEILQELEKKASPKLAALQPPRKRER